MAKSKFIITFNSVPENDTFLNLFPDDYGFPINEIFKPTRTQKGESRIWTDAIGTASRYVDAITADYNTTNLYVITRIDNVVTITATISNSYFYVIANTTAGAVTVGVENEVIAPPPSPPPPPPPTPEEPPVITPPEVGVPIVYDERIVLSRSPFNFKLTSLVLFDNVTIDMYLYTGDRNLDKPVLPTYQFTKKVIQAGQTNISIEISKMLNDMVKADYYDIATSGANTTSTSETVWCYLDAKILLGVTEIYRVQQQLLAVDGFGYHTELFNPVIQTNVLSTINEHIIYNDSKYPLYFKTKNLTAININGTNIPFTFNTDFSNQMIGYVNASNYANLSKIFIADFTYTGGVERHYFTAKSECKYQLINCIFKNKNGFWQTIAFNKLSKKSIDIESSDYMPVISVFGEYSLKSHGKRTTNVNAKEKISVNTDFLPESQNQLFTELMLSEFIYLEEAGQILPVTLNKKSFEKKTKINNKLIQYTMDFEYAFNLMNQVI
ncbi:MAG: hypothetical protein WAW57_15210 [Lutibacter sp.]